MSRKISALIIAIMMILPGFAFAHTDESPSIDVIVYDGGFVVDEVDTDADITVRAEDEGFNAGISSLQLLEGSNLIGRKECFYTLKCELTVHVHNDATGTRRYTGVVIDAGQNRRTESISVDFRGAEQPPEITFPDDLEVQEGSHIDVSVTTHDFDNDNVVVTASGMPRGAVFSNNVFSWTPDFEQSGSYSIRLTASDDDGSDTETLNIRVVNINREPSVNFSDTSSRFYMYEGDERKFSLSYTDPDKKTLSVRWTLDGRYASTSKTYTYKPDYDDAGVHTLVATVTDGPFIRRNTWEITVYDINRAPVLRRLLDKEIDEGEKIKFTVYASDKDGDALTYSSMDMPPGSTFNPETRIFEWQTHEGDAGRYNVVFKVKDSKGEMDAESVNVRVVRKFLTSHEKYHEFLELWEEQQRNYTQAITQPQNQPQVYQNQPTIVSGQELCRGDYLCYTVTYFFY